MLGFTERGRVAAGVRGVVVRRPTPASSGPAGDRFVIMSVRGRRPLKRINVERQSTTGMLSLSRYWLRMDR